MNKPLSMIAITAAALSLSACKSEPQEVTSVAPDPQASALANAAPVELPPAMTASKTFRCADNSLVYVDFFQGDKQVQLRTEKGGNATMLRAPEAGQAYTADGGYQLTGTTSSVSVTLPGKAAKSCKA
jgi:hypothetical protein